MYEQSLPVVVGVSELVSARANEIHRLAVQLKSAGSGNNKRSFQRLPKEERRRTQSHNPYRIPRRHRDGVLKEFETAAPKGSKRRRQDSRKSKRLLEIYHRRSDKIKWLPDTHIWHAKRFHMSNIWGMKLPVSPCEKQKRKMYRYASRKTTIHDRSYLHVIELKGTVESILGCLCLLGATPDMIGTPSLLKGGSQGCVRLYHPRILDEINDGIMGQLIAPVQFLWNGSVDHVRRLWIWCHVAAMSEATNALERAAQAVSVTMDTPISLSKIEGMARFELAGRQSLSRLCETLIPFYKKELRRHSKEVWNSLKSVHSLQPPVPIDSVIPLTIRVPEVLGPFPARPRKLQLPTSIELPTCLMNWPDRELGFEARDIFEPDVRRSIELAPPKRVTVRSAKRKNVSTILDKLRQSQQRFRSAQKKKDINPFIVDTEMVDGPVFPALPAHKPPSATLPEGHPGYIHTLLIRRCDSRFGSKYYDGWDIIVPPQSGANRIWSLLTRRGCRAIGLCDRRQLMTEAGLSEFPWDFPESKAGFKQAVMTGRELKERHFRSPPSKRVNFSFLSTAFPFCPNWMAVGCVTPAPIALIGPLNNPLLADDNELPPEHFKVLRPFQRKSVASHDVCHFKIMIPSSIPRPPSNELCVLSSLLHSLLPTVNISEFPIITRSLSQFLKLSLLAVRVLPDRKGVPRERSHLSQMSHDEMTQFVQMKMNSSSVGSSHPRINHSKKQPVFCHQAQTQPKYKTKRMRKTDHRDDDENGQIGTEQHKLLIGFVTSGHDSLVFILSDHCLSSGRGFGVGCVSVIHFVESYMNLLKLMGPHSNMSKRKHDLDFLNQLHVPCWMRSTTSLIHYPCWVSITKC